MAVQEKTLGVAAEPYNQLGALPEFTTSSTPTSEADFKDLGAQAGVDVEKLDDGLLSAYIPKNGQDVLVTWTKEEQARVVRKADIFLLPVFAAMFFVMALDRGNITGVLTSTFLKDANLTRDQANTGTSLLWLGIVILEIPSNVVLQRIGAHYWLPAQCVAWGLAEVLQYKVKGPASWYIARLALGLLESGFLPGALYTLSRWYTRDELAKRTVAFFIGNTLSGAFSSLIAAGCISIGGTGGLAGWQWIFIICGITTIFVGLVAFVLIPQSPYHTAGGLRFKGWLSEREADIYFARVIKSDPLKGTGATLKITWADIVSVLTNWRIWPHLLICLSGLQSTLGLGTWGAVIIKSLGFTAIRANLLNLPAPLITIIVSLIVAAWVDKYKKYGYSIIFIAVWVLSGLIALYHLPVTERGAWSFYAAYVFTQSGPAWQAIHITWVSLNARTPQQRSITLALYMGCSNLGGTYGNQIFRGSDAPLYRKAWAGCLSLGSIWLAGTILQTLQYRWSNEKKQREWEALTEEEQAHYRATTTDTTDARKDFAYAY